MNNVHLFNQKDGGGGILVLYGRHQIWIWDSEVPVWRLHYEKPKPEPKRVLRRRRGKR